MRKLLNRNEKGITLIALIVTIIVILVLAGVAISMLMGENGLLNQADKAVKEMDAAQVKERAEMVKLSVMMDKLTDKNATVMGVKTEFLNKLKAEFGADSEIIGEKIVIGNGKYVIDVENENLDIVVGETAVENSKLMDPSSILVTEFTNTKNEEEKGIDINIKLSASITLDAYIAQIKEKEENLEEKVVKFIGEDFFIDGYTGKEKTFPELVLAFINFYCDTSYTSLEDCANDETIQYNFGTTVEEIYNAFSNYWLGEENESGEMELAELKEIGIRYYAEEDYLNYTKLRLYVSNNGKEKEIFYDIDTANGPVEKTYTITENGTYEIILKTYFSRKEITREKFIINNL